jgi:Na+-transporting methylmalonyl-CoA/oxaloacetate decarboxylase gamma subunit
MNLPDIVSQGIIIAITGYVIVFLALLLLYFVFTSLSKVLLFKTKRKLSKSGKVITDDKELLISGEVTAAIAMAIYLSRDLHDEESDVLTIKRISRAYSPWNSKIYGMRFFRK